MGIGKQIAHVDNLAAFADWALSQGWRLSENVAFGGVKPVHTKGSWHYDTQRASDGRTYSLAIDCNYGPPGAPPIEREKAIRAISVAEAFGLGLIYARDGRAGSAAAHTGHLHVDCGPSSNYGRGIVLTPRAKPLDAYKVQTAVRAERDNQPGPDSRKRLAAVRAASRFGGGRFPHGVEYTQRVVGAYPDDVWGPNSRKAHDVTVGAIQAAVGVRKDYVWGPLTDAAVRRVFGAF